MSVGQVFETERTIELVSAAESDRGSLFALTQRAFGDFPGWSEGRFARVLPAVR